MAKTGDKSKAQTKQTPSAPLADFFVSYNGRDLHTARIFRQWAEAAGRTVHMVVPGEGGGSDFVAGMDDGIARCGRLLAIYTANYRASEACMAELNAMFAQDMSGKQGRIIVVKLDGTGVPAILGARDYWNFAGKVGERVREEFIEKVRALGPVKMTKPRKAKALLAVPVIPMPDSRSGNAVNVNGDGNKVAGGNIYEPHFHGGTQPRVELTRRGDEISAAQEREIQAKIAGWAKVIVTASKGKRTRASAFGEVQERFKNRFQIPKYSSLTVDAFDEAMGYVRQEIAKLTPKLLRADKNAGRNKLIGSIKQAMGEMQVSKEEYYPELARRLKMPPFNSLTAIKDRALKDVYRMARADARKMARG